MIIPFKFFRGKVYTDEFTFPIARRMSGRTIVQDLVTVEPMGLPSYMLTLNYDNVVIYRVRTCMRRNINWRGYETSIQERNGVVIILKIVSGINIGGMFQILYLITRDGNTERYNVSVPLVNLQRRG